MEKIEIMILMGLLGLIPGVGPLLEPFAPAIVEAAPVIIAAVKYAKPLIDKGASWVQAFNSAHPDAIAMLKEFAGKIHGLDPENISDEAAVAFATPLLGLPWTQADQDRWFKQADGTI